FFSERFLLQRPLLRAITAERRAGLLIDEGDRAEAELEAFFLEGLAEFQVSVPELGALTARHRPLGVLPPNHTPDVSAPPRRPCLHLWLDFPSAERELAIVRSRVPGIEAALSAEVVRVVQAVRALDLKKKPSVAETIDWARALVVLNADRLDAELARDTLNLLLKYEGDLATAAPKLPGLLASK